MNISDAARAAGLSAKRIRYYEDTGLLPPPARNASGYRHYTRDDVARMRFLARCRDIGFNMDEIRELLALRAGGGSRESVRALARAHLERVEQRREELERVATQLRQLVDACARGTSGPCPILTDLEGDCGSAHPGPP